MHLKCGLKFGMHAGAKLAGCLHVQVARYANIADVGPSLCTPSTSSHRNGIFECGCKLELGVPYIYDCDNMSGMEES